MVPGPTESVWLDSAQMVSLEEEGTSKGKELAVDTPRAPWLRCAGDRNLALRADLM